MSYFLLVNVIQIVLYAPTFIKNQIICISKTIYLSSYKVHSSIISINLRNKRIYQTTFFSFAASTTHNTKTKCYESHDDAKICIALFYAGCYIAHDCFSHHHFYLLDSKSLCYIRSCEGTCTVPFLFCANSHLINPTCGLPL